MKSLTESLRHGHGTIALRKLGPSYGTGTGHKYTRYWNLRTGTVGTSTRAAQVGPILRHGHARRATRRATPEVTQG